MILFDSDILIYASDPDKSIIRDFIAGQKNASASIISLVEVLGYSKLLPPAKIFYDMLFDKMILLQITEEVIKEAIHLRQKKKMSLGDSIIACTAIVNKTTLITNNEKNFSWIEGLNIINPFKK